MRHAPVDASHIRIVLSLEPDIKNGPGIGSPFLIYQENKPVTRIYPSILLVNLSIF